MYIQSLEELALQKIHLFLLIPLFPNRVLICQEKFDSLKTTWEESLLRYKREEKSVTAMQNGVCLFEERESSINLVNQVKYLNSLPNSNRWVWNSDNPAKQQVKFQQKFSVCTRYSPSSPRNRIIGAFTKSDGEKIVYATLRSLLGLNEEQNRQQEIATKKRRVTKKNLVRGEIDIESMCQSLGIDNETANRLCANSSTAYKSSTLYKHFTEKLFSCGILAWRVKRPGKQVVLMNDYGSESGEFKVIPNLSRRL